ncbi:hypothetical protein WJX73_010759 [Symbiochloris irregularis]|uniref:BZIP domain-containing protein n=1 Tax=Symbiochloris irregularis TaxID=706552 RepID=A0AAW1PZ84_9CHLO
MQSSSLLDLQDQERLCSSPSIDPVSDPPVFRLSAAASKAKADNDTSEMIVLHTGTDKHKRNRQAQARYRERLREKHNRNQMMATRLEESLKELQNAQAALQAERTAFDLEKERWQDSMQAASQHLQLRASPPALEFVVDPHRHSIAVLRLRMPDHKMAWLYGMAEDLKASIKILGWQYPCNVLTDDLCTVMFNWITAFKAASQKLLANHNAQPCEQSLSAMGQFIRQLRSAFQLYWRNIFEEDTWPQSIMQACSDCLFLKCGAPTHDHYRRCADAMRLTPQQQANIAKAYRKWQQQTAAAQHRSAHILPGMQALKRSTVDRTTLGTQSIGLTFSERRKNEQVLHKCNMEQKRAAVELHAAWTSEITAHQYMVLEAAGQPFGTNTLRLCEAIVDGLSPVEEARQVAAEPPSLQLNSETPTPDSRVYSLPAGPGCLPPADAATGSQIIPDDRVYPPQQLRTLQHPVEGHPTMVSPGRDEVLCSSSNSCSGASERHNQQLPSHSELADHAGAAQALHGAPSDKDLLLTDTLLEDVLKDLDNHLATGNATVPSRQDSWELQDLSHGLDIGDARELMQALIA